MVLVALNLRPVISAFGPLLAQIQAELHVSAATISLLTSVPLLCWGLFALVAPWLARWRSAEVVILGCLLLIALGAALRAGPNLPWILVGTVLVGSGIAVINVLLPSLLRRDFPGQLGLMTGLYTTAVVGGAALASAVTVPLRHALGSWRAALLFWSVPAVIGLLLWLPAVFGRPPRSGVQGQRPGNIWQNPATLPLTLYMGTQSLVFFTWLTWLPKILLDRGMPVGQTGYLLSLGNLIQLPFSLLVPVLAARLPSARPLVLALSTCIAVGLLGLLLWPQVPPVVWVAFLGVGSGSAFPLALYLVAHRARTVAEVPQLSSVSQGFGYLLAACGPLLLGAAHDLTHGWNVPLLLLLVLTGLMFTMGWWASADRPSESVAGPDL